MTDKMKHSDGYSFTDFKRQLAGTEVGIKDTPSNSKSLIRKRKSGGRNSSVIVNKYAEHLRLSLYNREANTSSSTHPSKRSEYDTIVSIPLEKAGHRGMKLKKLKYDSTPKTEPQTPQKSEKTSKCDETLNKAISTQQTTEKAVPSMEVINPQQSNFEAENSKADDTVSTVPTTAPVNVPEALNIDTDSKDQLIPENKESIDIPLNQETISNTSANVFESSRSPEKVAENVMSDALTNAANKSKYIAETSEDSFSGKSTPIIPTCLPQSRLFENPVTSAGMSASVTNTLTSTYMPANYINGGGFFAAPITVCQFSTPVDHTYYSSVSTSSSEPTPGPTVFNQDQERAMFSLKPFSPAVTTTPRRSLNKNPNLLLKHTLKKVQDMPNITDNGRGLTRLSSVIKKYVIALQNSQASGFINNPQLANEVLHKLTLFQRVEYGKFAHDLNCKQGIDLRVNPNLQYISEFLDCLLQITQYFSHVPLVTQSEK